jgi:hypothetical protein
MMACITSVVSQLAQAYVPRLLAGAIRRDAVGLRVGGTT